MVAGVSWIANHSLIELLNLPNQFNTITVDEKRYVFQRLYQIVSRGNLLTLNSADWDNPTKELVMAAAKEDLRAVEMGSALSEAYRMVFFAEIESFWLIHPAWALDKVPAEGDTAHLWECFRLKPAHADGHNHAKHIEHRHSLSDSTFISTATSMTLDHEVKQESNHDSDADSDATEVAEEDQQEEQEKKAQEAYTFSSLNKTILPDEYLRKWQFVLIIDHPANAFPDIYRDIRSLLHLGRINQAAIKPLYKLRATLKWIRILYELALDQYTLGLGPRPILLTVSDLERSAETGLITWLCQRVGLDPNVIQVHWIWRAQMNALFTERARTEATVLQWFLAQGMGYTQAILTARRQQWVNEFGGAVAKEVEKSVWLAMEDYRYLDQRAGMEKSV
ncbi:hypothetical protein BJX70DRAFT_403402 [Aspergillus crustosus]